MARSSSRPPVSSPPPEFRQVPKDSARSAWISARCWHPLSENKVVDERDRLHGLRHFSDLNAALFALKGIVGDEQTGGAFKKEFDLKRRDVAVPGRVPCSYSLFVAG